MKLKNETMQDIVTVEIMHSHEGNSWETGKRDVNPGGYPKIVTRGRTYSLKLTNARGEVWTDYKYEIGSGLTHDSKGREQHPSTESVMWAFMSDYNLHQFSDGFEDFATSLGYDTDSRKALETYLELDQIAAKARKFFTLAELQKLDELTEDM